jgi:hypothetical protein
MRRWQVLQLLIGLEEPELLHEERGLSPLYKAQRPFYKGRCFLLILHIYRGGNSISTLFQ